MAQERISSAMSEDIDYYKSDYSSSLEEQIVRLQRLVAHLLEKNEQLRRTIATQSEGMSPGQEV